MLMYLLVFCFYAMNYTTATLKVYVMSLLVSTYLKHGRISHFSLSDEASLEAILASQTESIFPRHN
jgi:hypothetical protein